ncbi:PrpF domain-containing protein [Arthrobacter bambusae]|uniref:PrpF domain-containing protein n=1 Tax=Arthrobacter bambusae TaxID=1338426 RepID=UPI0027843A1A|nr:PrpF domain-containing protein [Arthrobacter bambusae]MDQ0212423.1 2-methylaconitate cis-trans-isomerase PrpF [Arthrobacter bambusae]MDQ0236871.1 2-methylaconitate cis-trans-isomerase PrpF [Arthrobacter bambusae]
MQLRGHWYRGGTSKCWLFDAEDVAPHAGSREEIRNLLADAFGAADARQLDGVGGGTSTTSKAAVIRATPEGPADLDYLFAQVGIGDPTVELGSNCGNCATAIALYAVQSGVVPPRAGTTRVSMRNLNTGAVLSGTIATPGGHIPTSGMAKVPGSSALGVPVSLSFHAPWGRTTGAVLPTGTVTDEISAGGTTLTATLVDAGAPAVLIPADEAGIDLSSMTGNLSEHLPRLVAARASAGLKMGLRKPEDPPQNAVPKVGVVAAPGDYTAADGTRIATDSHDLRVRMLSMLAPHPAIGLTSAVAVSLAAALPGSVVAKALRPADSAHQGRRLLRIGTPAGVITTEVVSDDLGCVSEVALHRAARQLAVADIDVAQPVAQTA